MQAGQQTCFRCCIMLHHHQRLAFTNTYMCNVRAFVHKPFRSSHLMFGWCSEPELWQAAFRKALLTTSRDSPASMMACSSASQSSLARIPRSFFCHIVMSFRPLGNANSCQWDEFAKNVLRSLICLKNIST